MKTLLALGLALTLARPLAAADDQPGRRLFTEKAQPSCAVCHTLEAAGAAGTLGPSLDELKPDKARVAQAVRKGVGVMPAYAGKLSAEEIETLAAFVARAVGAP